MTNLLSVVLIEPRSDDLICRIEADLHQSRRPSRLPGASVQVMPMRCHGGSRTGRELPRSYRSHLLPLPLGSKRDVREYLSIRIGQRPFHVCWLPFEKLPEQNNNCANRVSAISTELAQTPFEVWRGCGAVRRPGHFTFWILKWLRHGTPPSS